MAVEYKALTYVNLPFLDGNGRLYPPGSTIPADAFEESARLAEEAIDDANAEITSAEDMIADLMQWGSLSDDPDAELHPAHQPVVPGQPTLYGLAEQAKQLIAQYEAEDKEVPQDLQVFADAIQNVQAADSGSGEATNA